MPHVDNGWDCHAFCTSCIDNHGVRHSCSFSCRNVPPPFSSSMPVIEVCGEDSKRRACVAQKKEAAAVTVFAAAAAAATATATATTGPPPHVVGSSAGK